MPKRSPIVAIVVDPEFGERLLPLANEADVWIADTPDNRPAAELLWSSTGEDITRGTVTTFKIDPGKTANTGAERFFPKSIFIMESILRARLIQLLMLLAHA